jgi:hypothetical protein
VGVGFGFAVGDASCSFLKAVCCSWRTMSGAGDDRG